MKLNCNGNNISYFFKGKKNYDLANSIILTDDGNYLICWCFSSNNSNEWFNNNGCYFPLATDLLGFALIGALALKKFQK